MTALQECEEKLVLEMEAAWTHWDLNPGPSACEADVIPLHQLPVSNCAFHLFNNCNCIAMGTDGLAVLVSANQDRQGAGMACPQLFALGINLSCYGTLDCKAC